MPTDQHHSTATPTEPPGTAPASAGPPLPAGQDIGPARPAGSGGHPRAWLAGIGWPAGGLPPAPTVDDLLPLDMRERMLEIWLATGTNVLYAQVQDLLSVMEEGGPGALRLVTGSMQADLYDRLESLRAKWEGGNAE